MTPLFAVSGAPEVTILQDSLFFSLLAGNLALGDRFDLDCVRHRTFFELPSVLRRIVKRGLQCPLLRNKRFA
jgi:hypothetical protein